MSEHLMRPRNWQINEPQNMQDAITYAEIVFTLTTRWALPEDINDIYVSVYPLNKCDENEKANWRHEGF